MTTTGTTAPRALLVGGTGLLVECAELLLEAGHEIAAVASGDDDVRRWCDERGVAVMALDDLAGVGPVDHLFSVANLRMLGADVLALPRRLAVNYHDGPLPRHAGRNAPAWAIAGGDTEHGITWHVMTAEADTGDVLVARRVPVGERDTTHDLDVRCFHAAVEAFAELVATLADGPARTPQDLDRRSYHGRLDPPPHGGVLSPAGAGEELDRVVRACDLGSRPNDFGAARLLAPAGVLLARDPRPGGPSAAAPGTVTAVEPDGRLTLATATVDVTITTTTPAGEPVPGAALAAWGVVAGHALPVPTGEQREAARTLLARARADEPAWVRRLAGVRVPEIPYLGAPTGRDADRDADGPRELAVAVPDALTGAAGGRPPGDRVLAAVLGFLVRVGGGEELDVGLRVDPPGGRDDLAPLFADAVPLRVPVPVPGGTTDDLLAALATHLDPLLDDGSPLARPPARDLWARHPRLRGAGHDRLPVLLDLRPRPGEGAATVPLEIRVDRETGSCRLRTAGGVALDALGEHLGRFLARLAADPGAQPVTVDLLDDHDRARLAAWNATDADLGSALVPEILAAQALRRPGATAVVDGDGAIDHATLHARARALAAYLGARGVGPGDLVGVHLPRSVDLVVALIGVLCAGAAYVPLDPIYPPGRIGAMLADSGARLVVTHAALVADLAAAGGGTTPPVVLLDRDRDAVAAAGWDGLAPATAPDPDAPAYVIYTSGSTGRPKGVVVGHRAFANLLAAMAREPGCGPDDRLLAVTTVCFDIAALELFLPLTVGGSVHVASAEDAADGFALADLITSCGATMLQATPATWRMLLAAGWAGSPRLRALCGGEALPRDLADALLSRVARLWNLYGPTETTIWSATGPVGHGERVTVGRPIANTRLHVLDAWSNPVPPGVPGELWIGGAGVADGYRDRPELTAERFRPGPDGSPAYRTGDRVRQLPDGRVEYLGRLDTQVKLHGYRIELGEVECALRRCEPVRDAVAVVERDPTAGPRLVAHVVTEGAGADLADLRERLATDLPEYMVPAVISTLPAIPLTDNGKVDRAALPRVGAGRAPGRPERALPPPARTADPVPAPAPAPVPVPAAPSVTPPAPTAPARVGAAAAADAERAVAAVWRETIGVDHVDPDATFFDAGGSSVLLPALVRRLREIDPTLRRVDVFAHPTVRTLARHLAGRLPPPAPEPAPDRAPEPAPEPVAGPSGPPPPGAAASGRAGARRAGHGGLHDLRRRRADRR